MNKGGEKVKEFVTEKHTSDWVKLVFSALIACMLTAILIMSFWISGHRFENEIYKEELAEQREEITRLTLSEGAALIALRNKKGEVTRALMDKSTAENEVLSYKGALEYGKLIIMRQANHIETLEAIMGNFEVPYPTIIYPQPDHGGIFNLLFGEEVNE
ncbi:hypothetical protein CMI37_39065 [Candidatus Pacearchaeota archaeon]|nr:hypothetical protein [Candidatus Pacearchaeota archaeon]|tara:strand:- start:4867 stop:5343 length:477 start_codon:yes stop_codon:yes gene_type:complete